jgi:hypothetical protein
MRRSVVVKGVDVYTLLGREFRAVKRRIDVDKLFTHRWTAKAFS